MPSLNNVNQLSLKYLLLYDQILNKFDSSLTTYSIEQCQYNQTAQFLTSSQSYNSISLTMINNTAVNGILPNGNQAFAQLQNLISLTLIDSNINSSFLKAIRTLVPRKLFIQLNSYIKSDFDAWIAYQPLVTDLTINNIQDLSIFSKYYFNQIASIQNLVLQGSFELEKSDICIFTGITIQPKPFLTQVTLISSSMNTPGDWNPCADTYIKAINQQSINNVFCPPNNTPQDCEQWYNETTACDLVGYENSCGGTLPNIQKPFYFQNSSLYIFFEKHLWANQTTAPSSTSNGDSLNIGAIIGAVCGLVAAVIILGITIMCIYRYRQNNSTKNIFSTKEGKYISSLSHDSTNISIATSKSSKTSRYALEKSFFPAMQPNDEIAPPLYTAPSESVRSVSAYNLPSAPPGPRDSISTHATQHVYETVDAYNLTNK